MTKQKVLSSNMAASTLSFLSRLGIGCKPPIIMVVLTVVAPREPRANSKA